MSIYDELLLSSDQMARLKQAGADYQTAAKNGDQAGMRAAHAQAEQIRSAAGYSGGADGSSYQLLDSGADTKGYNAYETIVRNYATSGMQDIATGYQNTLMELGKEREAIEQEAEQNQAAARSAVWGAQRLASDGLLTRGLENTGLADVITATTLNQASANAYQALLDRQDRLRAADLAAIDAKADALGQAAELQQTAASMLTDGYSDFYQGEAEREHEMQMDLQDHRQDMEMNRLDYQNDYNLNQQKYTNESALSKQEHQQDSAMSKQEHQQDSALSKQEYQQEAALEKLAHQFDIDLSKLTTAQKKQLAEQEYQYKVAIETLKQKWSAGK